MSAPLVWILVPGLLAGILFLLNRWQRLVVGVGTFSALMLAGLAWFLPVKEQFFLGPITINYSDTWLILGRRFVLGPTDRSALVILYLAAAFWFGAAYIARTKSIFIPLGLAILSLLTAALAVEPFLYAALLIEMTVLVSIPLLSTPGKHVELGVLRYLTLFTLGMPLVLFAGWMLSGVEGELLDEGFMRRASFLLGLGFALQLAVFPFHSWIPMLGKESHPYVAAFVFTMVPGAITLILLGFFEGVPGFGTVTDVYMLLRVIGVLMVVFAGLWAAFQNNLGSMLGYAAILEIGLSLIVIGMIEGDFRGKYLGLFYAMLFPRGLGLSVWALALVILHLHSGSLDLDQMKGVGRTLPFTTVMLVLAQFSLAGLPLLASFPLRVGLWNDLVQISATITLLALMGFMGLVIGALRTLANLVIGVEEQRWYVSETREEVIFLIIGGVLLLILGLFPQLVYPILLNLPFKFV